MADKAHILLVEDDPNFGSVLKDYLELNKYKVTHAADGNIGLTKFKRDEYDLCIFDVMMPIKDGFTLAEEVGKINFRNTPFIFLTAKGMKEDMVKGYKLGADDYLTKPFDSELLLYKIQAILQRHTEKVEEKKIYELGKFNFDPVLRELRSGEEVRKLSPKEAKLLDMLCSDKNEVVSRSKALNLIWKDDNYFTSRSMDVYIAKLRKYLKEDEGIEIRNIHGEGFLLADKGN
jgi:DNA-binding response OmpR family regulator